MSKRDQLAWHFLRPDWTTGKGGLTVRIGQPMVHEGELVPCKSGLHASKRIIDALTYAPSELITRVRCEAPFVDAGDKFVCGIRTPLWGYDAEAELRLFARSCAKEVSGNWQDIPQVVLEWLETGDPELRASASALAFAAAAEAAVSTCGSVFKKLAAARAACMSADLDVPAALAAANAACYAQDSVAEVVYSMSESAVFADAAAWEARAATRAAQNERLEKMIIEGAVKRGLTDADCGMGK